MPKAFYYDIVCPYAYMAFTFLRRSDAFKKNGIELTPILLGGLYKHLASDQDPSKSMPAIKASYLKTDIKRQAEFFSVPLNMHKRHPVSTVKAMRLIYACDQTKREAISERLYRAYWQENLDVDDEAVIKIIAREFMVSDNIGEWDKAKQQLIDATEDAFVRKVFGVPSVVLNNRIYFGGDRLVLIKDELGISWPDAEWQASDEAIDFYFDFSSPYSYLAWMEIKNAINASVKINLKPILLGALFKEIGMVNIPMLSAHPNKTAYYLQDMKDWANYRDAAFKFSSHFPLRSVTPLRVALIEPQVIDPIFTAAWSHDLDIGNPLILDEILDRAGFGQERLLERADDENVKTLLKSNTAEAVSRGVFGVPTMFVKGHKVFGQDRFSWVRRVLRAH